MDVYNTVLLDKVKAATNRGKANLLLQIPDLSQDGPSVLDGPDQLATVLQEIISLTCTKKLDQMS